MAHRVPITIRVDHFEGPLDLLLYLIQSHELDVSKVSISKITDQYLAYVRLMADLNFDVASDFLLMAATLIQWKSKSLLPQEVDPNALGLADGDDAMSPDELLRQLREHQRFLEAGRELGTLTLLGDDVFARPHTKKVTEKVWKTMEVTSLAVTFQDLLVKERKRTTILKKETVSLAEKILDFGDRLDVGSITGLRALLRDPNSRPETVVSFLATLELGRLRKMRLHQEKAYEEIYVELLESIKGFNTDLARGFDSIEEAINKGIAERAAHGEGHAAGTAIAAAHGDSNPDFPGGYPAAVDRGAEDSATHFSGTENGAGPDFGAEAFSPAVRGTESSAAAQHRIENSDAFIVGAEISLSAERGAEASPTDLRGTETRAGDGDSATRGFDLESYGESGDPDLRTVLTGSNDSTSGTGDGTPSDGRRHAERAEPESGITQGGRDES